MTFDISQQQEEEARYQAGTFAFIVSYDRLSYKFSCFIGSPQSLSLPVSQIFKPKRFWKIKQKKPDSVAEKLNDGELQERQA